MSKRIARILFAPIRILINVVCFVLDTAIIFRLSKALGDQVCMSALIDPIIKYRAKNVVVITNHPIVFLRSGIKVIDVNQWSRNVTYIFIRFLKLIESTRILQFSYKPENGEIFETAITKGDHLVHLNSRHFSLPEFLPTPRIFSNLDLQEAVKIKFNLPVEYICIHSQGKIEYTPNKEWGAHNFQKLIDQLPNLNFVQLGVASDVKLKNAIDLTGKTSFWDLVDIIAQAKLVICQEGLFNHLSGGLGVPCLCICSGFHHPNLSSYNTSYMLTADENILCAPCGLLTKCPVPNKPCTEKIYPERVVRIANHLLAKAMP